MPSLNLPPERYSLEVRRRGGRVAASSRSFDEALFDLSSTTGADVPKRQAEQLVARAAEDFDAFYQARRAAAGEPPPEGVGPVVLTFDGKGVVLHREDLRETTRKAAERRRRQRGQLSPFKRLKPGREEAREAHGDGGRRLHDRRRSCAARSSSCRSLMPRHPGAKPPNRAASPGGQTGLGEPRTRAGRGGRRGDAGSRAPGPRARQALGRPRRRRRDAARPRRSGRGRPTASTFTVVLDIIHVVEYVWKAAHVFHRERSPELEYWVWTRVQRILEGKARKVAAAMRRAATVAGLAKDTRKPVDTCADYLLKYAPYLHYDRYPRGRLAHCHRSDRGGVSIPGPRPDGVDRGTLAPGRSRGGPEAAGATGQRQLRCVLGLSRSPRVTSGTTPSDTLTRPRRRSPNHPHRRPHRAFDESSSSCRAARRDPMARPRRRAAPFPVCMRL